ncbi:MAG: DinB family protein [Anaerolineales bacterium]
MTKAELVRTLTDARQQLDAALAGLTEAQLAQPGVVDDWAVKDALIHVTAWAAEVVTGLSRFKRKIKGWKASYTNAEIETVNDKIYRETKNRSLDRVLADYHGVHKQLLRQIEALSQAEIDGPSPWAGHDMIEWILDWVADHEREHAEQIAAWRKQFVNGVN